MICDPVMPAVRAELVVERPGLHPLFPVNVESKGLRNCVSLLFAIHRG